MQGRDDGGNSKGFALEHDKVCKRFKIPTYESSPAVNTTPTVSQETQKIYDVLQDIFLKTEYHVENSGSGPQHSMLICCWHTQDTRASSSTFLDNTEVTTYLPARCVDQQTPSSLLRP
jgi:hypothetical protein